MSSGKVVLWIYICSCSRRRFRFDIDDRKGLEVLLLCGLLTFADYTEGSKEAARTGNSAPSSAPVPPASPVVIANPAPTTAPAAATAAATPKSPPKPAYNVSYLCFSCLLKRFFSIHYNSLLHTKRMKSWSPKTPLYRITHSTVCLS